MKQKLILFQPKQYNELFSSYHSSKKNINPNRVNLPKISTNFLKEWDTPALTCRTNNTTSNKIYLNNKNFSSQKNSYIFDRNRDFYPILTQTKGSETSRITDILPYPSVTQHFKKIIDNKSKEKKKVEKNKKYLKMIYLNLLSDENNKKDYQIESFLTESNENEKVKNDIINDKINEINNNSKKQLQSIFCQTDDSKIQNDIRQIHNIPIVLINLCAEEIYKNYYNNINLYSEQKTENNKNFNKQNIKLSYNNNLKNNLYINNKFFQYVLDNVKHKIEIISENNKTISVLYVKNLINNELKYFQQQISDYKKQYTENTSNNISKISNYEIISRNTFKFKTNNSSSMKDNENNSTNNNSSVLGSLIKKNIYSKKNEGTKKRKFDSLNFFHIVDPNTFFQNKQIIQSINKKYDKNDSKKIKIEINSYKHKKKAISDDEINNKNNLTSNSMDQGFQKIKSKRLKNSLNKKIERTFSQVFLKTDFKKESDYIKEISNKIEKKYLYKKNKTNKNNNKINKYKYDKDKLKDKDKGKNNNENYKDIYNNNTNYDEDNESYIITPKRVKKTVGTNTDFKENKIKFKNEKMKNNYEKIIKTITNIKKDIKKMNYFTPNKDNLDNKELYKNENQKKKPILFNNNKLIKNYIQNINNINNNDNKKVKNIKDNNTFKNTINSRNNNKNKDLNSIKTSKPTNKKVKQHSRDNTISNNSTITHNKKSFKNKNTNSNSNKKRKKNKLNNINKTKNNKDININNKNEITHKLSIKVDDSDEEEYEDNEYDEYEEDDEEDEEDEEEEEEEEEDEENGNEDEETKKIKRILKKIKKEKKKEKKRLKKKLKKMQNLNQNQNNNSINKNFAKRNSVMLMPLKSISIKSEIITPKRNNKKSLSIIHKSGRMHKSEKIHKFSESLKITHHHSTNRNKRKSTEIRKNLFKEENQENAEYEELKNNEIKKYNMRNLTKNKKIKKFGGGGKNEKFSKEKKNKDESALLLEDNVDDLIKNNKNNLKPKKKNSVNYDREEEIKILKEVEEMDEALTLDEKKHIIAELTELRQLLFKTDDRSKETRDKINSKRISIYKIVNKFFTNWIIKDLSMKIVDYQKYKNKLDKLELIQSYRIYSEKNLKILETKYIMPYLENEKRKKKEEEAKKAKLIRRKIANEEFEKYKRLIEEKKRKGLVYDNSYLFKKGKKKQFTIRKEVIDILNTDYGKYYFKKKKVKSEEKKKVIKKKKIKKERKYSKKSILEKKEMTQQEKDEENERIRLFKEMEEKQRREEIRDKRLKNFFERIRRLKNGQFKNFEEEINYLIDEQIDQAEIAKENKEMRMNSFMKELQFNRVKAKFNTDFKNKQIGYISPFIFITDKNEKNN